MVRPEPNLFYFRRHKTANTDQTIAFMEEWAVSFNTETFFALKNYSFIFSVVSFLGAIHKLRNAVRGGGGQPLCYAMVQMKG